jgi:Fe2+ transport system protein B
LFLKCFVLFIGMLVLLQILDVVGVQKHACLAQSFGKKLGLFFHGLYPLLGLHQWFYVLILLTWHRKLPVSAWILALIQQTSSFEYPSVELKEIPSVLDGSGVPSFWFFFLDFKCHLFSAWILPCYSATRALYVSCVGSLFESDFLFMKNTHLTLEWMYWFYQSIR